MQYVPVCGLNLLYILSDFGQSCNTSRLTLVGVNRMDNLYEERILKMFLPHLSIGGYSKEQPF